LLRTSEQLAFEQPRNNAKGECTCDASDPEIAKSLCAMVDAIAVMCRDARNASRRGGIELEYRHSAEAGHPSEEAT
jgi:hypothetical protein